MELFGLCLLNKKIKMHFFCLSGTLLGRLVYFSTFSSLAVVFHIWKDNKTIFSVGYSTGNIISRIASCNFFYFLSFSVWVTILCSFEKLIVNVSTTTSTTRNGFNHAAHPWACETTVDSCAPPLLSTAPVRVRSMSRSFCLPPFGIGHAQNTLRSKDSKIDTQRQQGFEVFAVVFKQISMYMCHQQLVRISNSTPFGPYLGRKHNRNWFHTIRTHNRHLICGSDFMFFWTISLPVFNFSMFAWWSCFCLIVFFLSHQLFWSSRQGLFLSKDLFFCLSFLGLNCSFDLMLVIFCFPVYDVVIRDICHLHTLTPTHLSFTNLFSLVLVFSFVGLYHVYGKNCLFRCPFPFW